MHQLHQVLDQQDDQLDIMLDQFLFQHQLIHQVQQKLNHFVQHKVKQFLKEVDDIEDDLHYLLIQYQAELQFLDQPIFCVKLNFHLIKISYFKNTFKNTTTSYTTF
jgi:hypothetical protein